MVDKVCRIAHEEALAEPGRRRVVTAGIPFRSFAGPAGDPGSAQAQQPRRPLKGLRRSRHGGNIGFHLGERSANDDPVRVLSVQLRSHGLNVGEHGFLCGLVERGFQPVAIHDPNQLAEHGQDHAALPWCFTMGRAGRSLTFERGLDRRRVPGRSATRARVLFSIASTPFAVIVKKQGSLVDAISLAVSR
jgi:hypothetical protein